MILSPQNKKNKNKNKKDRACPISRSFGSPLFALVGSIGVSGRCARASSPCVPTLLPVEDERRFDNRQGRRRVTYRAVLDQRV